MMNRTCAAQRTAEIHNPRCVAVATAAAIRFNAPKMSAEIQISRIVTFLVSEDAGFVTGSTITANGGQYFI